MPTLAYRVPAGQDPAAILTALRLEGYEGTPHEGDSHLVHIDCPADVEADRERVRQVIGSVGTSAIDAGVAFDPGSVRFTDETTPESTAEGDRP